MLLTAFAVWLFTPAIALGLIGAVLVLAAIIGALSGK